MTVGYLTFPVLLRAHPELIPGARLYLSVIPVILMTHCCLGVIQAELRIKTYTALKLLVPVGYLSSVVVFRIIGGLSVVRVVQSLIVINGFVLMVAIASAGPTALLGRPSTRAARDLIGYGLQVYLADASQIVNIRLDQLIITAWLSTVDLGVYTAALAVSSITTLAGASAKIVLVPSIPRIASDADRAAFLRSTFLRFSAGVTVVNLSLFAIAGFGIPIVFGSGFERAVGVARLMLVAATLAAMKDYLVASAQGMGVPFIGVRGELGGLTVTAITMPIAVAMWGLSGAALSCCCGAAMSLCIIGLGVRREGGWSKSAINPWRRRPTESVALVD